MVASQYGTVFQVEVEAGEYALSFDYTSETESEWLKEELLKLKIDPRKIVKANVSSNSITVQIGS